MMNCPNCGAPIDREKTKCPYCETPYTQEKPIITFDYSSMDLKYLIKMDEQGLMSRNQVRSLLRLRPIGDTSGGLSKERR